MTTKLRAMKCFLYFPWVLRTYIPIAPIYKEQAPLAWQAGEEEEELFLPTANNSSMEFTVTKYGGSHQLGWLPLIC